MRYFRAYQFIFGSAHLATNLVLGVLCQMIPVIGPIVYLGYEFEVVEALHTRGDDAYPDFDFNRFTQYLMRGLWVFLMNLLISLPAAMLIMVLVIGLMAGSVSGARATESATPVLVMLPIVLLVCVGLGILLGIVLVPLSLRAGLSQEFALSGAWEFVTDFLGRVWLELLLSQLFLAVTAPLVVILGLLICFIGVYPAGVVVNLAQHHLIYQLYELYLERGGTEIALKVEAGR